jgi:hypothetical protein
LVTDLVLLWTSVVLSSYGTHLKSESPQLEEYETEARERMAAANPGSDGGSGIGIGIILASTWQFVGCVSAFMALVLMGGLLFVHAIALWNRKAAYLATGALALLCMLFVYTLSQSAKHHLDWGFDTLGSGELLVALALLLVAVGSCSLVPSRSTAEIQSQRR